MNIKQIFDEISSTGGNNAKMDILRSYSDNELLKRVLYMANSKRIKFYIKKVPDYVFDEIQWTLDEGLDILMRLANREITGQSAIDTLSVLLGNVSSDDAYIIERVIEKDCKIGMGSSFINKVFKGLIEETPYQGCMSFDIKKAKTLFKGGNQVLSEVKADGRYVNVIIRNGEVEMESRQGELTVLGDCFLTRELGSLNDCVLNGELIIEGISRLISNGIIASIIDYKSKFHLRSNAENQKKMISFIKEKGMTIEDAVSRIKLKVWDIINIDEYFEAKSDVKRIDRFNRLKSVIGESNSIEVIEHRIVSSYEDAMVHFAEVLERGEEGTVIKSLDGGWKNGKHSYQLKLKLEMNLDLEVIGFNYGAKGTKNENVISSIACKSSCGRLVTNAQGLTEKLMEYVTDNQDKLLGTIIEIKCNGISTNSKGGYSVFYPSLSDFRDDKSEANSLEECFEIQNSKLGLTV